MTVRRCFLLCIIVLLPIIAQAQSRDLIRISTAWDGGESNGGAVRPSLSADGRFVAFDSYATNLVPNDANGFNDVFVHDLATGVTERASVGLNGAQANEGSYQADISGDGRYVVFLSWATNLTTDTLSGSYSNVFVYDRLIQTTELISIGYDGSEHNADTFGTPAISSDGRYVAFESSASNLVPDDTNGMNDIFLYDRSNDLIKRISLTSTGQQLTNSSRNADISADGRYVSFQSYAPEITGETLVGGAFRADTQSGVVECVSWTPINTCVTGGSPSISEDGNFVVFQSASEDMAGHYLSTIMIFIRDMRTDHPELLPTGLDSLGYPTVSGDGRYVAFNWRTSFYGPNYDVYLYDRVTTDHTLLTQGPNGTGGDGDSDDITISADGQIIAFESDAPDLVDNDTNGHPDIFVMTYRDPAPQGDLPDIDIAHIEITQVVQDEYNSVPLAADKPTLVRVYVDCKAGDACPVSGVTAVIEGPGGETIPPLNRSIVAYALDQGDWLWQRLSNGNSLNFILPPEWTQAGNPTFEIRIGVRLDDNGIPFHVETGTLSEPFFEMKDVTISETDFILNSSIPDHLIKPEAKRILVEALPAPNVYFRDSGSLEMPYPGGDFAEIFQRGLMAMYLAEQNIRDPSTFQLGWSPRVLGGAAGVHYAYVTNAVLVSTHTHNATTTAGTLMHEIAHASTVPEISTLDARGFAICVPDGSEWPYENDGRITEYGVRFTGTASWSHLPPTTWDVMSYCRDRYELGWVSPYTYIHYFNHLVADTQNRVAVPQSEPIPHQVIHIAAMVDKDNNVEFMPPRKPIVTTADPNSQTGEYCAETRDTQDVLMQRHCFDLAFIDPAYGQPSDVDLISVPLTYTPSVWSLVITRNGVEIGRRTASSYRPNAQVTYPNGGEVWQASQDYTITWTGGDIEGDEVIYDVYYSIDNGVNWRPLAMGLTDTALTVNTDDLAGSDTALIQVRANDGFYTTYDQSDAIFSLPSHAPEIVLFDAEEPITLTEGIPIILRGMATDPEDEVLPNTAYSWSSDQDGTLGSGSSHMARSLSVGTHEITLTVTDSDNNSQIATQQVTVIARTAPTAAPALASPNDGRGLTVDTVTLSWDTNAGGDYYHIQIDDDPNFGSPLVDETVNGFKFNTELVDFNTYYWRVRAYNDLGPGPWSAACMIIREEVLMLNEQQLLDVFTLADDTTAFEIFLVLVNPPSGLLIYAQMDDVDAIIPLELTNSGEMISLSYGEILTPNGSPVPDQFRQIVHAQFPVVFSAAINQLVSQRYGPQHNIASMTVSERGIEVTR